MIQLSIQYHENNDTHKSFCENMSDASQQEIFSYYNFLNNDVSHTNSKDDICTPMECVKKMLDYLPAELWHREKIKILDPCCGNGNFGAYCKFKTELDNIWFNEVNPIRYANCKKILNPKHITNENFFNMHTAPIQSWDLIMANPPYSGGGNKNKSVSNAFIEYSIEILKDKGYLCFITPNNWMTYNNKNVVLHKLLTMGSFLVIDNDAKKFFPQIGSSFKIFVWQKGIYTHKTKIVNNYLIQDIQENVIIPSTLKFIPLYISQAILDIIDKIIQPNKNNFKYRCDLHNFTKKKLLSDIQSDTFKFATVHTPLKTRYASIKQDIYDKWIIIVPLSTYYKPYIMHNVNITQSVGYFYFDTRKQAEAYLNKILQIYFKVVIHLTRYGNFNNIKVIQHLNFDNLPKLNKQEKNLLITLSKKIKY